MSRWSLAVVLGGLIALSCGTDSPTADGGGFGGETLTGMVVGVSGKGLNGAAVRLRESRSLEAAALRSASTDNAGMFRIPLPTGNAFRLEVAGREGDDSVRALIDLDPGQPPGRILAEAPPLRSLQLRDATGNPVQAVLQAYGLGRTVATDASGRADLTGWPSADLWARANLQAGGAQDLFVPAAVTEIQLADGWLVDDFEGAETRTRLGSLIGGGWWYVASQGADSLSTRDIARSRDALDSHDGQSSLHAKFSFSSPASTDYGLVGFHFGPTQADTVDLSGLDSLDFWIKGRGRVRVEFVSDTGGGVTSHAREVDADSVWTRHVVTASALAPIDAGRSFAEDSRRVRFLQFIVFQEADFRLDGIRYYGSQRP